jgi:hypothetical protein
MGVFSHSHQLKLVADTGKPAKAGTVDSTSLGSTIDITAGFSRFMTVCQQL